MQNLSFYLAFKQGQAGSMSTSYLWIRPGPFPQGSDSHLGTFWARPASESVQKQPDPHGNRAQNTDLDALNPTILFIRRETAGKAGTKFGFHPNKALSRVHYHSCGDHHSPLPPGGCGGKTHSFFLFSPIPCFYTIKLFYPQKNTPSDGPSTTRNMF